MGAHNDISWATLQQIVREWAGDAVELRESRPLEGGSISTTLALTLGDGRRAVLKITPHRSDPAYADEAVQLEMLKGMQLPVPHVHGVQVGSLESPNSYLLLDFVEGMDLGKAKNCCAADELDAIQAHLAELLLRMHEQTSTHYMKVTAAESPRFEQWPAFYRSLFDPIVREVMKAAHLPVKQRKMVQKIHDRLDRLLAHDDVPRLIHGDLWSANLMVGRENGDGAWKVCAILDPELKYAHTEMELAYLDLFHTATPAFMRAYQSQRKLPPEYHRVRKPVYQLYSLLSDLAFYGLDYLKPVMASLDKVAPLV